MNVINNIFPRLFNKDSKSSRKDIAIKKYTLIVKKENADYWKTRGWIEEQAFHAFNYSPKEGEVLLTGKVVTLAGYDKDKLVGAKIKGFSTSLGCYGMGGPGYFGLLLEPFDGETHSQYIVFAVWGAYEYCLVDDRIVSCHPKYNNKYHPLTSNFAGEEQRDELSPIIKSAIIESIKLTDDMCVISFSNPQKHQLVMVKNSSKLPPTGKGNKRQDAYSAGIIADHIVFQHENAVIWT